jgi:hypothetical protein
MRRLLGLILPRPADPAATRAAVATDDPENPDNWYGLDYVHDRISSQLQEQSKLYEEVDGRLRLILGVIGVVFAATLGLLPRGTTTVITPAGPIQEPVYLPFWVGALAIVAIVVFSLAGLVALVGYWPRAFSWPPAPQSLPKYITSDEREIKLVVVDEMLNAYTANSEWLVRKIRLFQLAFALAALAAGILGASVTIEVLQFTRGWS